MTQFTSLGKLLSLRNETSRNFQKNGSNENEKKSKVLTTCGGRDEVRGCELICLCQDATTFKFQRLSPQLEYLH